MTDQEWAQKMIEQAKELLIKYDAMKEPKNSQVQILLRVAKHT